MLQVIFLFLVGNTFAQEVAATDTSVSDGPVQEKADEKLIEKRALYGPTGTVPNYGGQGGYSAMGGGSSSSYLSNSQSAKYATSSTYNGLYGVGNGVYDYNYGGYPNMVCVNPNPYGGYPPRNEFYNAYPWSSIYGYQGSFGNNGYQGLFGNNGYPSSTGNFFNPFMIPKMYGSQGRTNYGMYGNMGGGLLSSDLSGMFRLYNPGNTPIGGGYTNKGYSFGSGLPVYSKPKEQWM